MGFRATVKISVVSFLIKRVHGRRYDEVHFTRGGFFKYSEFYNGREKRIEIIEIYARS